MKHIIQIIAILCGVAAIFVAAELLPVGMSYSSDKKLLNNIQVQENQNATAGIAYELTFLDKVYLLSNPYDCTFTRLYHTDSAENLKQYDATVLEALWEAVDSYNLSAEIYSYQTGTKKDVMPLYIRLTQTDDTEAGQYLTEASCIFVSQTTNTMGGMTLWLLTFEKNEDTWQFLLDPAQQRLCALWEEDTQKDWSGYMDTVVYGDVKKSSPADEIRYSCLWLLQNYYGASSAYGMDSTWEEDSGLLFENIQNTETEETYSTSNVPVRSSCYLLDPDNTKGIRLSMRAGQDDFYKGIASVANEWKDTELYEQNEAEEAAAEEVTNSMLVP